MDNCKTHYAHFVVKAIHAHRYKPLFLPPYLSFLNPIEECWAKIKTNTRNPLKKGDELTPRIAETCRSLTSIMFSEE